uniref:C-type lectin domain-containing protein n=1 Tax=Kryptolebias marmoratus TaxID=37003 RepID=A0A3Q3AUW1_KRYMA
MRNICIFVCLLLVLPLVCVQQSSLGPVNFIYYKKYMTWKDAQSFCREKHTDLVTIKDENENQAFTSIKGWLGLYRENSNSPWKWSRGDENATFLSWADNGKLS